MPDSQGNFQPGGLSLRGKGGELRCGFRIMTELGRWGMDIKSAQEDGSEMVVRLTVSEHDPDQWWMDHAPADEIVLNMRFGNREMEGPARILNQSPKLVLEATVKG